MERRLPTFLVLGEGKNIYSKVVCGKPSGKGIADAKEASDTNPYIIMKKLVSGCIVSIEQDEGKSITDRVAIVSALGKMSVKNLEYLAQEIMIDYYDGDDGVEGVYFCPRCNTKKISEIKTIDGMKIDTRDFISDLKVNFMESPDEIIFNTEFEKGIEIKTRDGEDLVLNIDMEIPTVDSMIEAVTEEGLKNEYKLQYSLWSKSIKKVNGVIVDKKWQRTCGKQIFNNSQEVVKDMRKIANYINKFGINERISKTCDSCGKVWQPLINTRNFFDSALQ